MGKFFFWRQRMRKADFLAVLDQLRTEHVCSTIRHAEDTIVADIGERAIAFRFNTRGRLCEMLWGAFSSSYSFMGSVSAGFADKLEWKGGQTLFLEDDFITISISTCKNEVRLHPRPMKIMSDELAF